MSLPRLGLCVICKDEAHCITDMLNDVVKYIDYWVVCDTGSTDGTQEIVKNFFEDKKIPGELHEDEWKDFGHNRTLAFERCHKKMKYAWVIDCDDRVEGEIPFEKLFEHEFDCAKLIQRGGGTSFSVNKIFRMELEWKYVGVLHEYPKCITLETPKEFSVIGNYGIFSGRTGNRNKNPNKYADDAIVLEKELEREPENTRTMFYLAQSYYDSQQWQKSLMMYKKRYESPGFPGERFYSLYRVGLIFLHWYEEEEKKESPDKNRKNNLEQQFINAMIQAHLFLPERAEPLYIMAKFYNDRKRHQYAYYHAVRSLQMKRPSPAGHGGFFMLDFVYDWAMLYEYSMSCYNAHQYEEGRKACINLIANPKIPENFRAACRCNLAVTYLKALNTS